MSNTLCIVTNNIPRKLISVYEMTEEERNEFDYIDAEEILSHEFFRYKGQVYDPSEFMCVPTEPDDENELTNPFRKWHGYSSDSFFSGIVIRYTSDMEQVIVGTYYS